MATTAFRVYRSTGDFGGSGGDDVYALDLECSCGKQTYLASWRLKDGVPNLRCRGCKRAFLPKPEKRAALGVARKLGVSWSDALLTVYGLIEMPEGGG